MPRARCLGLLLLGLAGAGSAGAQEAVAEPPVVAAAADLRFALEDVAAGFRAAGGGELRLLFGSSGELTRQIEQGAPFQLFFSADEDYALRLADGGRTEGRGVLYAIGRIALFAATGSPLGVDEELDGLRAGLASGTIEHFAIANPEHAPYGRAAREALQSQGLWESLSSKLVLGENAAQAAQFAGMGSAQGGILPWSIVLAPQVAKLGRSALLPAEWHRPLRQRVVLLKGAGETARRFYAFVQGPEARGVLGHAGFLLPGVP